MRKLTFLCACLFLAIPCAADTFTHRLTGESFNGYVVQRKKGNKTQVRVEGKPPQYLDLSAYEIRNNYLGRKNKVFIFSIEGPIGLICETEALEKAIVSTANQGPLFILLEIDTPGGRIDLAKRICTTIMKMDNCRIIAFISGDQTARRWMNQRQPTKAKFGGAFSAGAIIALACDKIYMREGTAVGAAAAYVETSSGSKDLEEVYGQTAAAKFHSAWRAYCSAVAERSNRPGLIVQAMVDEDIEVIEVVENGERFFIDLKNKKPTQSIVRTWSEKGSLLTLTAVEAVQCGIADKVVASRDELFADLAATKATHVHNTDALKARREFEQAQHKFNKILLSISSLEKRVATLAKEVATLDEIISRTDKVIYHDGILEGGWTYLEKQRQYNPTAVKQFFRKSEQCLKLLKTLRKDYKKALPMARKYPDLHHHVTSLEEGLKFAEATYKEVLSRLS